jgi:hypothetical protein
VINDGELAAEDVADVFVGLGVEANAAGENIVLVEFLGGLARAEVMRGECTPCPAVSGDRAFSSTAWRAHCATPGKR